MKIIPSKHSFDLVQTFNAVSNVCASHAVPSKQDLGASLDTLVIHRSRNNTTFDAHLGWWFNVVSTWELYALPKWHEGMAWR